MQSQDTIDNAVMFRSIFYGFWVFGLAFFSTELGQQCTNESGKTIDTFNQLRWYLFPIEIQRLMPTIMIGVQQPFVIESFGIVSSNRDQFKKVRTFDWFTIFSRCARM